MKDFISDPLLRQILFCVMIKNGLYRLRYILRQKAVWILKWRLMRRQEGNGVPVFLTPRLRSEMRTTMKSLENKVDRRSDYFIHLPSEEIAEYFLYPTHLGHFIYQPGYRQHRLRFDSFLLMYILEGSLFLEFGGKKWEVPKNSFVLIDCYQEHSYYSDAGWEAVWVHFDGRSARRMYEMSVNRLDNVFSLADPLPIINNMARIYQPFAKRETVKEILLSKYLNDILTELIVYTPLQIKEVQRSSAIENARLYIQEHIQEELRVEDLARKALMSTYHFIRVFKKETNMTPHEYIIHYRLRIAKLLLKETDLSVNDICYESGFSSSSIFCAAFKKGVGMSPTAYRREGGEQMPLSQITPPTPE